MFLMNYGGAPALGFHSKNKTPISGNAIPVLGMKQKQR